MSPHLRASVAGAIPLVLLLVPSVPASAANGPLFAAPFVSFDTGFVPYSVAIGDLNGDGKPDLVATRPNFSSIVILLGNRDGTFAPKSEYTTGTRPHSLAIAD